MLQSSVKFQTSPIGEKMDQDLIIQCDLIAVPLSFEVAAMVELSGSLGDTLTDAKIPRTVTDSQTASLQLFHSSEDAQSRLL